MKNAIVVDNPVVVGVDIDGVITNEGKNKNNIWYKHLCRYTGKNLTRKNNAYNFAKAYGLSNTLVNEFLDKKLKEVISKVKPKKNSSFVLNNFKKMGLEIILITSRPGKKEIKNITKSWLKRFDIYYDDLYFTKNKGEMAKKIGVDIFIEDGVHYINKILKKTNARVLMMNKYHNKNYNFPNRVTRVYNWQEIESFFKTEFSLKEKIS